MGWVPMQFGFGWTPQRVARLTAGFRWGIHTSTGHSIHRMATHLGIELMPGNSRLRLPFGVRAEFEGWRSKATLLSNDGTTGRKSVGLNTFAGLASTLHRGRHWVWLVQGALHVRVATEIPSWNRALIYPVLGATPAQIGGLETGLEISMRWGKRWPL